MSRTIATILNLKDLFSPTLRETVNNTKEFQRQIQHTQNDIAKFRDGVSESFGNVKTKIAGVVAGLGVAEFAKQSVELASNLVEVQNVVDQTFGSGATQINNWSKTALTAFGLNQLQAKQFTGYLGAMMKSSGITGDALTKMSENLVGLAGDMASFDNLDPEVAFEKIRSGISGETEPLKEIGINMDVTNLKAYALSQGIKKSYESMSQAEQTTLRYNYLMSVTADKHGDFAKTQNTFANQMRIAKANIEQAGASIATGFLPYLNKLLLVFNTGGLKSIGSVFSGIGNTIISIANSAKTPVQSLVNSIKGLAQATGLKNLFSGIDTKSLNDIKYIVNSIIYGIRDMVSFTTNHIELLKVSLVGLGTSLITIRTISTGLKLFDDFKKGTELVTGATSMVSRFGRAYMELRTAPSILVGIKGALSSIFTFNPMILGIVAGVALFAALAYEVITHWSQLKTFFTGLWAEISQGFTGFVNGVKNIFGGIWNIVKSGANTLGLGVISAWNTIKNGTITAFNAIKNVIVTVWGGIKTVITAVVMPIVQGVLNTWNSMKSGISTIFTGIKNVIQGAWTVIKSIVLGPVLLILDLVTGNWNKLGSDTKGIFNNLANGLRTIWGGIKQIFSGSLSAIGGLLISIWGGAVTVTKTIWNGLGSFFIGLWSGIKNGAIAGWNALKLGVVSIFTGIGTWIVNTFNAVVNWFATLPSRLYQAAVSMFTSFKTGISNTVAGIGTWISNAFTGFINFFTSLPGKALTWAKDMIDGFIQGIKNKIADVKKGAESIADTIRGLLHHSKPDEGPLKPDQEWMPDMVNGMALGITNTTPNIVKSVTDMATNMTVPINNFVTSSNTLGVNAIQELSAGISSQESNAVTTAQNLATKILQGVKDIFGIRSPSKAMGDVGINFMQGFIDKLKSSNIADVVKKVFGDIASLANGTLGGALSGIVSNFINTGDLKGLGGMLQGVMQNGLSFLGSGSVSGNVSEWLAAALAATGTSMDWLPGLLKLVSYESGDPGTLGSGDASLVNSVPVGNEYATGLLQMLPSTFREFTAGIGDITNPVANAAAAIRYIKSRYGSVYNTPLFTSGGRYNGYATGTNSANKGIAELAEDGAELVTGKQFRNLHGGEHVYTAQETKGLLGGKSIKMTNNFYFKGNVGNEEFFEEAGSYITTKFRTALNNM